MNFCLELLQTVLAIAGSRIMKYGDVTLEITLNQSISLNFRSTLAVSTIRISDMLKVFSAVFMPQLRTLLSLFGILS